MRREVGIVFYVNNERGEHGFDHVEFKFFLGPKKSGLRFGFIPLGRYPRHFRGLQKFASGETIELGRANFLVHRSAAVLSWERFKPFEKITLRRSRGAELVLHKAVADHLALSHPDHMIWDARYRDSEFNSHEMERIGLPIGDGFMIKEYARKLDAHLSRTLRRAR